MFLSLLFGVLAALPLACYYYFVARMDESLLKRILSNTAVNVGSLPFAALPFVLVGFFLFQALEFFGLNEKGEKSLSFITFVLLVPVCVHMMNKIRPLILKRGEKRGKFKR
jgi:hypothetical protein